MRTSYKLAAVMGLALGSLYIRSMWIVVAGGFLANAGTFQVGMILLQMLKLAVIFSFRRLRDANMVMIFDIFSIELLTLPLLVVVSLLSGSASITGFEVALFSTWPLSLAVVFVPFAAFRVVRGMARDEFPSSVIPGAVLVTGLSAFAAQVVSASATQVGSPDFTKSLVGGFVSEAGTISPVSLDPIMAVALPTTLVSLVVYAALSRTPAGASPSPALLIALLSSFLVLLWTLAVVSMPGVILYFGLPTFGLLAVVWWFGRGQ